ncbi:penicillin-binding protein 1A [Anopheles sinensis]|uniref:Penicillin-binding protein 1A n=1 Tax=Anopheles sinensis TaxID=74873 RepID=A0A084VTY8_ANOSI|nr:penicillin-binding protein 1A [Anopheles sinensis]
MSFLGATCLFGWQNSCPPPTSVNVPATDGIYPLCSSMSFPFGCENYPKQSSGSASRGPQPCCDVG